MEGFRDMDSGRIPWGKQDDGGLEEGEILDWTKILAPGEDPGWGSWDQSHQIRRTDSSIPLNKVEPSGKDAGWNPWEKSNPDGQLDAAISWKKVESSAQSVPYQWRGADPWKKSGLEGDGVATTPWSNVAAVGARWSPDDRSDRYRSYGKRPARCRSPAKRSARRRSPGRRSARRSQSPEKRSSRWSRSPERSSRRSRTPERSSWRSRSPIKRSRWSPDKRSSHREESHGKRPSPRSWSDEKRYSCRSRSPERRSSRWSRSSSPRSRSPVKRSSGCSRSPEKRSSRLSRSPERSSRWNPEKSACQSCENGSARCFNKDHHSSLKPRKRSFEGCQEGRTSPSKKDEHYGVPECSANCSGSRGRWMPCSEIDEEQYGGVKISQEKGKDISWDFLDESEVKGQADLEISRGMAEASVICPADGNRLITWEELFRKGLAKRNINEEKVGHSPPRNHASHSKTAQARLEKHPPITCQGVNSAPLGKSFPDGHTDDAAPSQKLKVTGAPKKSVGLSVAPMVNHPPAICSGKDAGLINKVGQAILRPEKTGASVRHQKSAPESATVLSHHVKPPAVMSKGKQVVLIPCEKSVRQNVQKKIPKAIFLKNRSNGPALAIAWKGSFEVLDFSEGCRLCEGFIAHPSGNLSRKASETAKNMGRVLQFRINPRLAFWPKIFENDIPDKNDVALYFYPGRIDGSRQKYSSLLKLIDQNDLMLRSCLEHVELLVFSSRKLTEDCQKLRGNYYMWGVFRSLRGKKAASNKTRPAPPRLPGLPAPKKSEDGLKKNVVKKM